jgi:hypothetical protein
LKKTKDEPVLENNIYKLGLHETIKIDKYDIIRVPGGWLYYNLNYALDGNISSSCTFVPLNYEFQEEEIVK